MGFEDVFLYVSFESKIHDWILLRAQLRAFAMLSLLICMSLQFSGTSLTFLSFFFLNRKWTADDISEGCLKFQDGRTR